MKIYLAHARGYDFINELYNPIKNSDLGKKYEFVFPHSETQDQFDSKNFFKTDCKLVVAEDSYPKIGLGIELGWANLLNIPIICVYKKGQEISGSLKVISNNFIEYENSDDLVDRLKIEVIKFTI